MRRTGAGARPLRTAPRQGRARAEAPGVPQPLLPRAESSQERSPGRAPRGGPGAEPEGSPRAGLSHGARRAPDGAARPGGGRGRGDGTRQPPPRPSSSRGTPASPGPRALTFPSEKRSIRGGSRGAARLGEEPHRRALPRSPPHLLGVPSRLRHAALRRRPRRRGPLSISVRLGRPGRSAGRIRDIRYIVSIPRASRDRAPASFHSSPPPAAPPATYQRGEGPRAAGRERPLGLRLPEERRRGAQSGGRRLSSTPRCVYRHHVALPYLTKTSPVLRTVHRLAIFSPAPSTRRIHTNFLPKKESPKNGLQRMLASPSQLWRWLCRSVRWPRVSGAEGGCEESGSARCGEVQAGLRRRHRRSLCAPNSFQS